KGAERPETEIKGDDYACMPPSSPNPDGVLGLFLGYPWPPDAGGRQESAGSGQRRVCSHRHPLRSPAYRSRDSNWDNTFAARQQGAFLELFPERAAISITRRGRQYLPVGHHNTQGTFAERQFAGLVPDLLARQPAPGHGAP